MIFNFPRNSCCYSISGTTTFRLGSRMLTTRITHPPREGKRGSNMQNWEKGLRRIYVSDGWNTEDEAEQEKLAHYLINRDLSIFTEEERSRIKILVQPDQAGAEALIVAYLCRHGNFRELFLNNIKSHVYVALFVFAEVWKQEMQSSGTDLKCDIDLLCHTPIKELTQYIFWRELDKLIRSSDKWSSDKRYYYIAKQICHSSNYGIRAEMFRLNTLEKSRGRIVISKAEAERYLSIYHGLFPEIHEWHRQLERQLTETKRLYNLFGYPRYFWFTTTNPNDNILKEAYAYPAQSTVGTITNKAFTELQTYIEDTNKTEWDLLQNNHDSYMSQVPVGMETECAQRMQEFLNVELIAPSDGTKFHMKSECAIGFNWAPWDKDNNKLGMREI